MTTVRMLKYYGSLNRGETAGFEDAEAKRLIDAKIAERIAPAAAEATYDAVEVAPSQHAEHPTAQVTGGEVTEPTPVRPTKTKR